MKLFVFLLSLSLFLTGCNGNDSSTTGVVSKKGFVQVFHNQTNFTISLTKPGQTEPFEIIDSNECSRISPLNESKVLINKLGLFIMLARLPPANPPAEKEVDISKNNYHTITVSISNNNNVFSVDSKKEKDPKCSTEESKTEE